MQAGWRIGSLFGIPLYIDASWLVVVFLIAAVNGVEFSEDWNISSLLGWSVGLLVALLLFASVVLHELGHSLVARSQGITVNSITLFLFGGVASIARESETPAQAFQVAIAGPAVSFALFLLLAGLAGAVPEPAILREIASDLSRINLILALFNLIPGLPLDGGQILKAAVWQVTGNRFTGVRWAARAGQFLGSAAIALGILVFLALGDFSGIWIALIGWFGVRNATTYERITLLQITLQKTQTAEAMSRDYRVVDANLTLRQFADEYLIGFTYLPLYFAASEGRYRGMVELEDFRSVERSLWETKTVRTITRPLDSIPSVREETPLVEAILALEANQRDRLTVLSPADAVAGTIDRGDIVDAIAKKLQLPIPNSEIKRVKLEGTYPVGFNLVAIAESLKGNR